VSSFLFHAESTDLLLGKEKMRAGGDDADAVGKKQQKVFVARAAQGLKSTVLRACFAGTSEGAFVSNCAPSTARKEFSFVQCAIYNLRARA
jgi:hypothetical protein